MRRGAEVGARLKTETKRSGLYFKGSWEQPKILELRKGYGPTLLHKDYSAGICRTEVELCERYRTGVCEDREREQ